MSCTASPVKLITVSGVKVLTLKSVKIFVENFKANGNEPYEEPKDWLATSHNGYILPTQSPTGMSPMLGKMGK